MICSLLSVEKLFDNAIGLYSVYTLNALLLDQGVVANPIAFHYLIANLRREPRDFGAYSIRSGRVGDSEV
jgi:hypothetical protein